MLRPATVILVGAMALAATAAPRGRVVRVERTRAVARAPILCMMQPSLDGICIGTAPAVGVTALVVNEQRTVAEVRITKVQPFDSKRPACDTMWRVNGDLVRGDMTQAPRHKPNSVIDDSVDPKRARFVEHENYAPADGGHAIGIDNDRDGDADILFSETPCTSKSGSGRNTECVGIWTRDAKRLKRITTLDLRSCSGRSGSVPPP